MKHIPSSPKVYDTIFHTFSKKVENITGYMKYVMNELEENYYHNSSDYDYDDTTSSD